MSSREPGSSGVVLTIDSVVKEDLGIYFCVALNSKNVAYAYVELGKITGHYTIQFGAWGTTSRATNKGDPYNSILLVLILAQKPNVTKTVPLA